MGGQKALTNFSRLDSLPIMHNTRHAASNRCPRTVINIPGQIAENVETNRSNSAPKTRKRAGKTITGDARATGPNPDEKQTLPECFVSEKFVVENGRFLRTFVSQSRKASKMAVIGQVARACALGAVF